MATKNTPQPPEIIESEPQIVECGTLITAIDPRRSIVVKLVGDILAGQKLDLDKLPNQEARNKIVSFAKKLADDIIAATN